MNNQQPLTIDTQNNLDDHAEFLRLGDTQAARQLAATQPAPVRQLMEIASSLAVALPAQGMASPARLRLRQQLVSDAQRQVAARSQLAPLAERGIHLGRRSMTLLQRPEARQLFGAGTAMIAAVGVALIIYRRQGQRNSRSAALAGLN